MLFEESVGTIYVGCGGLSVSSMVSKFATKSRYMFQVWKMSVNLLFFIVYLLLCPMSLLIESEIRVEGQH